MPHILPFIEGIEKAFGSEKLLELAAHLLQGPAAEMQEQHQGLKVTLLYILLGWSVINMLVFGGLYFWWKGAKRFFAQMNFFWNVVNLGLAGSGLYQAFQQQAGFTLKELLAEQHSLELLLAFNAGLDVAYLMTGVFLLEKAKTARQKAARWQGYGQALLLQGGFLFLFDGVFLLLAFRVSEELRATLMALL